MILGSGGALLGAEADFCFVIWLVDLGIYGLGATGGDLGALGGALGEALIEKFIVCELWFAYFLFYNLDIRLAKYE